MCPLLLKLERKTKELSTKKIETLAQDILALLKEGEHKVTEEHKKKFGEDLAQLICDNLWGTTENSGAGRSVLRMSSLGNDCDRQLWLKDKNPGDIEPLPPEAKLKYLYGHILEHLLLFLAKEAGHEVLGEQTELEIDGVLGHRDAVIDGVTTDVKSASTFGFVKFKEHKLESDDPFGYLKQIFAYVDADKTLPDRRGAFLAIDKQFGHIVVDVYDNPKIAYDDLVKKKKESLASLITPPRAFMPEADGKSGNLKLGTKCSYCDVKNLCWPSLRTFIYSSGPRYLTHVERLPDVKEV